MPAGLANPWRSSPGPCCRQCRWSTTTRWRPARRGADPRPAPPGRRSRLPRTPRPSPTPRRRQGTAAACPSSRPTPPRTPPGRTAGTPPPDSAGPPPAVACRSGPRTRAPRTTPWRPPCGPGSGRPSRRPPRAGRAAQAVGVPPPPRRTGPDRHGGPTSSPPRRRPPALQLFAHLLRGDVVAEGLVKGDRGVVVAEDVQLEPAEAPLAALLLGGEHDRSAEAPAAVLLVHLDAEDERGRWQSGGDPEGSDRIALVVGGPEQVAGGGPSVGEQFAGLVRGGLQRRLRG